MPVSPSPLSYVRPWPSRSSVIITCFGIKALSNSRTPNRGSMIVTYSLEEITLLTI